MNKFMSCTGKTMSRYSLTTSSACAGLHLTKEAVMIKINQIYVPVHEQTLTRLSRKIVRVKNGNVYYKTKSTCWFCSIRKFNSWIVRAGALTRKQRIARRLW